MSSSLTERLNQVLPRITSEAFLSSEGIGNEIACYIFDYPADEELYVRDSIDLMLSHLASHHSDLRVLHLDLFEVVLAYLKGRGLLDKALAMMAKKGDVAVLRALRGPLAAEKIRDFIASQHDPASHDLILLSGVGRVWPILRAHGLLNCLHTITANTPLVMFYPGNFDGTTLRLFGKITGNASRAGTKPYYRAFVLVPGGTST